MQCPQCRHENSGGAKFCQECGSRLAPRCPSCGHELPAESKFCNECGHRLTSLAPSPEPRAAAPSSYTPKHLAERILTSKTALEGERKQVTVLFADLKGSMELLADRDPEDARKILDPVLTLMMDAVHRFEGTVNQVMGDGIMALFGAPLAHEDHAVRACYAALRMQETVKTYAEGVRRSHGILLQIRVGLNSGEVVVRSIGSDLHMDYSAIGQTTHLAARMEQMAAAGSILVTPETLHLAEDYIQAKSLGPMPVKGRPAPMDIFEVTGASLVRSRFQAASTRGLTRFVGRDLEMEQLRQALDRAREGHGQIAAVAGEPGVGKSRLCWEFTHSHRTQRWLVVESRSVSYGKATSYLPVIDLLKAYFDIEGRDDPRRMREKVTGKVLGLDESLRPLLPPLLSLLDLPVDEAAWRALDPPLRRQRTLDAVKRLLLRESKVQPLIVVFEDLHWIDSETQAVLDALVESLPTAQLLLLVNYRPEYHHSWGSKTYYRQLQVDPLPPTSAADLLTSLLGDDSSLKTLVPLLIQRTEGNPFFLEESVRTLVETGVLVGEPGARCLAKALPEIQVSASVQAVLAARIDRLSPEDKRVVQAAAVVGKDVPFALLSAIAEVPEQELRRSLTNLQTAEFLYETQLFPDLELTFKHALTHEVTYGSVLHERRRALHARIVGAIEACYADRVVEHVDRLAHHCVYAEMWDKAVGYLRQAGVKAIDRSAHREAIAHLDRALEVIGHLADSEATQALSIDIRVDLWTPLLALGALDQRLKRLQEAQRYAEAIGDRRRLVRAVIFTSNTLGHMGRTPDAVETARRGVELVQALDDPELVLLARHYLGQAQYEVGAYAEGAANLRQSVATLRRDQVRANLGLGPLPSVLGRFYLGLCLVELGEFDEAAVIAREAVEIAEGVDHVWSRVLAYVVLATVEVVRRGPMTAIDIAARSMDLCTSNDLRFLFPNAASLYGHVLVCSGRIGDGISVMERAMEASQAMRRGSVEPFSRARLSEGYLLGGRPEHARDTALGALQLAEEQGQPGQAAWVYRALAEIAGLYPDLLPHSGEYYYREALVRSEALGMRPIVARCHLGLGKVYTRTGKRDQARKHLSTAITMLREMGMTFWLDQAEAELKELG